LKSACYALLLIITHMVYNIALLYLLAIKLTNIFILRRLSSKDAKDMYKGKITSYANNKAIAIKVVSILVYASYLHVYLCLLVS
jgi:hypothetical protein